MKTINEDNEKEKNEWQIAFRSITNQMNVIEEMLLRMERGEDKEPDFDRIDSEVDAVSDADAVDELNAEEPLCGNPDMHNNGDLSPEGCSGECLVIKHGI